MADLGLGGSSLSVGGVELSIGFVLSIEGRAVAKNTDALEIAADALAIGVVELGMPGSSGRGLSLADGKGSNCCFCACDPCEGTYLFDRFESTLNPAWVVANTDYTAMTFNGELELTLVEHTGAHGDATRIQRVYTPTPTTILIQCDIIYADNSEVSGIGWDLPTPPGEERYLWELNVDWNENQYEIYHNGTLVNIFAVAPLPVTTGDHSLSMHIKAIGGGQVESRFCVDGNQIGDDPYTDTYSFGAETTCGVWGDPTSLAPAQVTALYDNFCLDVVPVVITSETATVFATAADVAVLGYDSTTTAVVTATASDVVVLAGFSTATATATATAADATVLVTVTTTTATATSTSDDSGVFVTVDVTTATATATASDAGLLGILTVTTSTALATATAPDAAVVSQLDCAHCVGIPPSTLHLMFPPGILMDSGSPNCEDSFTGTWTLSHSLTDGCVYSTSSSWAGIGVDFTVTFTALTIEATLSFNSACPGPSAIDEDGYTHTWSVSNSSPTCDAINCIGIPYSARSNHSSWQDCDGNPAVEETICTVDTSKSVYISTGAYVCVAVDTTTATATSTSADAAVTITASVATPTATATSTSADAAVVTNLGISVATTTATATATAADAAVTITASVATTTATATSTSADAAVTITASVATPTATATSTAAAAAVTITASVATPTATSTSSAPDASVFVTVGTTTAIATATAPDVSVVAGGCAALDCDYRCTSSAWVLENDNCEPGCTCAGEPATVCNEDKEGDLESTHCVPE